MRDGIEGRVNDSKLCCGVETVEEKLASAESVGMKFDLRKGKGRLASVH